MIHATASLLEEHGHCDKFVLLKVDFKNAFNMVDRSKMLALVREHFPELFPWVRFCYSGEPKLWFREVSLTSACGVQQGDPLGPFLFSLVLHELVRRIDSEVPDLLLNGWYLDDGALIGEHADAALAYRLIERHGPPLGLHLNPSKCELFWPSHPQSPPSSPALSPSSSSSPSSSTSSFPSSSSASA